MTFDPNVSEMKFNPGAEVLRLTITMIAVLASADRHAEAPSRPDAPAKVTVTWKGKKYAPNELPKQFPVKAARAVHSWQDWAEEQRYRMEVDDAGSLVFILRQSKGKASNELKLIDKSLGVLGEMAQLKTAEVAAKKKMATDVDPAQAMVLVLTKGDAYESAIEQLVLRNENLRAFASAAKGTHGFALPKPLVALLRENPQKKSEWEGNVQNEFVSQLAQLNLLERYGRQPYWVLRGWSWYVELAVMGEIYTFPNRDSFVGVGAHSGWAKELRREFRSNKRKNKPLTIEEFAGWQQGSYDDLHASHAWGMMTFLQEHFTDRLGGILKSFDEERFEMSKVWVTTDTWRIDVDYVLSGPDQLNILAKHTHAGVLEEATEFFRKGKSYKPSKR